MSNATFYREMREKTDPLWEAIFHHPFVKGIGDGALSRDRFEFYLKQDFVYLIDFSRVFALACAKSRTLPDMGTFATLLQATLNTEMELHRKTCADLGIAELELAKTRKSPVTSAYTDLLVRTAYEGGLSDILAVLLPCACGYAEIGKRLKSEGLPEDRFYRDRIDTYSSPEFQEFADGLIGRMNENAADAPAQCKEHWHRLYESSARYEYLFFDMSWKKEEGR
ncbi:MAG: thiaminase II [Deltaproteobacteria bacterium CG2_30_66_27]|nr:MAG: thiaminase II [Deltaproteobacteria bacterium CG2_30_66_27]